MLLQAVYVLFGTRGSLILNYVDYVILGIVIAALLYGYLKGLVLRVD